MIHRWGEPLSNTGTWKISRVRNVEREKGWFLMGALARHVR